MPPRDKKPQEKVRKYVNDTLKKNFTGAIAAVLILALVLGFAGGVAGVFFAPKIFPGSGFNELLSSSERKSENDTNSGRYPSLNEAGEVEDAVVGASESASPSVVSVVATRDLSTVDRFFSFPFGEDFRQRTPEERQVAAGTGFVAAKNLVVTNKHVVSDQNAEYKIVTSSGDRLDASVLSRDPIEDLAILEVPDLDREALPLGNSENVRTGQFVITIGNALGEFQNSVSLGVVSGLSRTITTAGSGVESEVLRQVIQTDAAINFGNSGGPLLNLNGEVVGVNVAKAQGAENIGFAIPINRIKNSLKQAQNTGEVKYPFLGVRYTMITPDLQATNNLPFDYGALIVSGESPGDVAVVPGSAADRAGLEANDIILEINGERVTDKNPLGNIISSYDVGDTVTLKVYQEGNTNTAEVTLGERS